ncbi:hypothetical protein [Paracidovorax konjaci]|uniref:hypothetical protein n=1 Tax=Paracidovorax konjaci TaxID=32040 RepID=UPI0011133287|nr:hypothetical protein [Paracidovorax konjaci]
MEERAAKRVLFSGIARYPAEPEESIHIHCLEDESGAYVWAVTTWGADGKWRLEGRTKSVGNGVQQTDAVTAVSESSRQWVRKSALQIEVTERTTGTLRIDGAWLESAEGSPPDSFPFRGLLELATVDETVSFLARVTRDSEESRQKVSENLGIDPGRRRKQFPGR